MYIVHSTPVIGIHRINCMHVSGDYPLLSLSLNTLNPCVHVHRCTRHHTPHCHKMSFRILHNTSLTYLHRLYGIDVSMCQHRVLKNTSMRECVNVGFKESLIMSARGFVECMERPLVTGVWMIHNDEI